MPELLDSFLQHLAHYSIITPLSSPKQINPLAVLPLLGSPMKFSVRPPPSGTHLHRLTLYFFTLNCFGLLPTATINLKPPPKSHSTPHLSSPPHLNLELFENLLITSYTELKIAIYPHHPLWLPYHSYLSHTSVIKSQSYILAYKPTPLPPSSFSATFTPPLLQSFTPARYSRSTIYSFNHLIHIVISIMFLPLY